MHTTPIIIDCDTGRDDALTIWTALSSEMDLCGVVTSYGNTNLDQVTENTLRVLSLAGRNDIPVLKVSTAPQTDHKGYTDIVLPRQETGGNGLCNVILPEAPRTQSDALDIEEFAEAIQTLADKHGSIDYYIIGPTTNFGRLIDYLGPQLKTLINRVVMMGGKLEPLWSEMPGADFNLVSDPYSFHKLLIFDIPLTLVPMNTTWPISMHLDNIKHLEIDSDIGKHAKELMISYCIDFSPDQIFRFHDPTVLFTDLYKKSVKSWKLNIILDENSIDFGRLDEDEVTDEKYDVSVFLPEDDVRQEILKTILNKLSLKRTVSEC